MIDASRTLRETIVKKFIRMLNRYYPVMVLFLALSINGCFPTPKVPIDTIHYDAGDVKGPRLLFVFLHGNGDRNSVFDAEGFVTAVRSRGLPADMISVDAYIGYYINGSIVSRLKQDVIEPARVKGYERIWLISNSLGGFGSLLYAREYPNEISGMVLLGPFLGEQPLIKEIRNAGGLSRWDPGQVLLNNKDDAEKHIWLWLKEHGQPGQVRSENRNCPKGQGCVPRIYLGYGTHDRFAYGQDFLASLLPPEQVIAIDGGHDWSTWKKLWDRFLDQNIFSVASP